MGKVEKNYSKLYSLYGKINKSSFPDSVKEEYNMELSSLYSELSEDIKKD